MDVRTTLLLGAATLAVVVVAAFADALRVRRRRGPTGGVLRLGGLPGTDDEG